MLPALSPAPALSLTLPLPPLPPPPSRPPLPPRYEVDKLTASQRLDLNLEKVRMRDELQMLRDKANELEIKVRAGGGRRARVGRPVCLAGGGGGALPRATLQLGGVLC